MQLKTQALLKFYTKTSSMSNLFNTINGLWEVITLWTRPSENYLFGLGKIEYHFVDMGTLPNMIELGCEVYISVSRNNYQIDIISIFTQYITN